MTLSLDSSGQSLGGGKNRWFHTVQQVLWWREVQGALREERSHNLAWGRVAGGRGRSGSEKASWGPSAEMSLKRLTLEGEGGMESFPAGPGVLCEQYSSCLTRSVSSNSALCDPPTSNPVAI